MLTFILAISYLTTSNLPWLMDLTFQVPMKYCSLQHQTLLLSPVTSTTGCCFCLGSNSSFFLELFLHLSLVAYWVPTDLGSSSFSVLSFCLFILFIGSQGKNTEVVCLGNEQRSFCRFWDCIQVLHFELSCCLGGLLHFFYGIPAHSSRYNGHLN